MVSRQNFTKHSTPSRSTRSHKARPSFIAKFISCIIILALLSVIAAAISSILLNPERRIKHQIEQLATDYYESYLYPTIVNHNTTDNLPNVMAKYSENGFTPVTLRQLLLFRHQSKDRYSLISQYCNANDTLIYFYPDSPYSRQDYHVRYEYYCDF